MLTGKEPPMKDTAKRETFEEEGTLRVASKKS